MASWLSALGYGQYSPLLVGAGYDLTTLARATPEDLTGAGVSNIILVSTVNHFLSLVNNSSKSSCSVIGQYCQAPYWSIM